MAEDDGTTGQTDQGNTGGDGDTDSQSAQVQQDGTDGADGSGNNGADGQTDGEDGAGQGDGDDGNKAPEEYADFTLPEGFEMDQTAMDLFKPFAKEKNLTQEQAQEYVDLYSKLKGAENDQFEATKKSWADELKADPDLGGAKLQENMAVVAAARNRYGNEKLAELLDVSGLGSHPEVVRFFFKVGQATAEDKLHQGGGDPGAAEKTPAQKMSLTQAD